MNEKPAPLKSFVEDLIKKRIRKKVASSEFYKKELPEHLASSVESAKETVLVSFVIFIIFMQLHVASDLMWKFFLSFYIGWFFWKICQVAIAGWIRLNRLHKVIEEEKFEIEHHRKHERSELEIMYKAKGFSGELLNNAIDVLMADDNRLLQVMMEEEMGLTLRTFEHPLKLSFYAGLSTALTSAFLFLGLITNFYNFFIFGFLVIIITSIFSTRFEKNILSFSIVWNTAILSLICTLTFFAIKMILSL